jgi:exodeoxyribonuclease VII small subunit
MAVKKGFEEALQRLEKAVDQLEAGELTLEQSLKVFSDGVKQAEYCRKSLNQVELQVAQLLKQADGTLKEEAFDEQQ